MGRQRLDIFVGKRDGQGRRNNPNALASGRCSVSRLARSIAYRGLAVICQDSHKSFSLGKREQI